MGTNNLSDRTDGQTIGQAWFNDLRDALATDIVPRNLASLDPVSGDASLGSSTYPWKRLAVASGEFILGDIKYRHSYNGSVAVGQGWMLCDGRQITQATYDAEHGAGSWESYIGSSDLENKYLPNLIGRYGLGSDTTTETGASAMPTYGNASHQVNLEHLHQWYDSVGSGTDNIYNSSGVATALSTETSKAAGYNAIGCTAGSGTDTIFDMYSNKTLSTTQSIQPESIEAMPYIRII